MGIYYKSTQQYEKSLECFQKTIGIEENAKQYYLENPDLKANGHLEDINKDLLSKYENICSIWLSLQQNDKALDYAYQAINIIETTDSLKSETKLSHLEKL